MMMRGHHCTQLVNTEHRRNKKWLIFNACIFLSVVPCSSHFLPFSADLPLHEDTGKQHNQPSKFRMMISEFAYVLLCWFCLKIWYPKARWIVIIFKGILHFSDTSIIISGFTMFYPQFGSSNRWVVYNLSHSPHDISMIRWWSQRCWPCSNRGVLWKPRGGRRLAGPEETRGAMARTCLGH